MTEEYVVGFGEVLWDVFDDKRRRPGGAPAIFAYHAAQSGFTGAIISAVNVGDECLPKKDSLTKTLKSLRLMPILQTNTRETGEAKVFIDENRRPSYIINTNAAWKYLAYKEELNVIASHCRAVYFGTLAVFCGGRLLRKAVKKFMGKMPEDSYKVFDVNFRYNGGEKLFEEESIKWGLKLCNVLKANKGELDIIYERIISDEIRKEREKCRELMQIYKNISIIVLTKGSEGSTIYWRDKTAGIRIFSSAYQIEIKNPVGAGDAFVGAFIGSLLTGRSYLESYDIAAKRAQLVCTKGMSMPKIPAEGVFVSYSYEDSNIVDVFIDRMEELGIDVWRDTKKIDACDRILPRIKAAINDCKLVIFFSSANSNSSIYVKNEIGYAKDTQKRVFVVRLDGTPLYDAFEKQWGGDNGASLLKESINVIVKRIHNKMRM